MGMFLHGGAVDKCFLFKNKKCAWNIFLGEKGS